MITVFIANRDPDFTFELRSLIDWPKLEYMVVGTAGDGTRVMGEIMRKQPDLVFISNDLPGLNGLEVIEKIREHGHMTEFVLIEDKGDFALAQKAMRLGVREFLVNPVSAEEITRVLGDFMERYQAVRSKDMERYLFSTRRLLRNSFMRNFVSAEVHQNYSINELNKLYHFTFKEGFFQGALIQLRGLPKEEEAGFLPAVVEELRFRFDPVCNEMIPFIQGASRLTILFNYSADSGVDERMGEICEVIKYFLKKHGCQHTSYSIGIGSRSTDVNSLLSVLHSAERAAYCGILRGSNQIYFMDQLSFDNVKKSDIITPEFLNELRISVELMDISRFEQAIRKAFENISVNTDPEIIVDICRSAIIEIAKSYGDADAVTREEVRKVLYFVMNASSLSIITSTLVKNARTRLEAVRKEREFSRPVREATKYIKNNFTKNITLANVADYVHLNASYLSMLFKKETGRNYIDFLTDCRIDEAKKLLKDSSLSVAEICYAVGYTDKKHFSRLFIKKVGVRPTAYRSLH
ncbi:MAG: helix-turn-helix domain-containing protein [Lachnospiraceae bacterium]|jgi:two-component system response regulator YesN